MSGYTHNKGLGRVVMSPNYFVFLLNPFKLKLYGTVKFMWLFQSCKKSVLKYNTKIDVDKFVAVSKNSNK